MKTKFIPLLKDLADVLEKHSAGLTYTVMDDGVHVTMGDDGWNNKIRIGFISNGDVSHIREVISNLEQIEE